MGGNRSISEIQFIVDHNAGKMVRWLRMLGFNSVFFNGEDDSDMIKQALAEDRVILTRDTGIMKRRIIAEGRLKAILLKSEEPKHQILQLMTTFDLKSQSCPFTICLECNQPLVARSPNEVRERVPPYVYRTQTKYMECPACNRIYWRGTHWAAMLSRLESLTGMNDNK